MLGLASTAEVEVIQAVYRALAKKYHPDVYKGDKAEAERIMKDLNEAIGILSDPKLREQYDSTRANTTNSTGDFDETIHESKFSDEEVFDVPRYAGLINSTVAPKLLAYFDIFLQSELK